MASGIAGGPPAWGVQVLQQLQALQQGQQNLQQGLQNLQQNLQQSIDRSSNLSAIAGGHSIIPLNDAAGQSPAAAGIWFPDTLSQLMSATSAQENVLINFYGLALLPALPGESGPLRRRRTLYRHLGVRM